MNLVVDVDDRHVSRDEASAADSVMLRGAFVESLQDLAVVLLERVSASISRRKSASGVMRSLR